MLAMELFSRNATYRHQNNKPPRVVPDRKDHRRHRENAVLKRWSSRKVPESWNCEEIMTKESSQFSKRTIAPLESQNASTSKRKPKIYDCHEIFESVAWIWRLFGVFPITIKGPTGAGKYGISKFHVVYSFLVFSVCFGNFVEELPGLYRFFSNELSPVITLTVMLRTISSILCIFLSNPWRTVRHKELSEAINKLSEHDIILEKMNCRLNHESSIKIIRAYVWTTFLTIILLMAHEMYGVMRATKQVTIRWALWNFPMVVNVINLTILVSFVGLLGLKFRALNDKINLVAMRANASSPKVIVTSDVCAENLRLISKAHYNICVIGKRINSIYNCVVIINVTTAFIILSTTLYFIFYEVQRNGVNDYGRILSYIYWEFIHSAPIIVIVIVCNWTTSQAIYTGRLIHEIRVECTDSRLYEAIKSFSLQLHHQKMEFTAGGFFPLNSTLLQTMIGTITTYLVILIQFQPKLD